MADKQCEICDREIIRHESVPPMLEPVCVLCAHVVRAYIAKSLVYEGHAVIGRMQAQGSTYQDVQQYIDVSLHNAGLDNEEGRARVAQYLETRTETPILSKLPFS